MAFPKVEEGMSVPAPSFVVPTWVDPPTFGMANRPTEYLWPMDGNVQQAAQNLASAVGPATAATNYSRQLALIGEVFGDWQQPTLASDCQQLVQLIVMKKFRVKDSPNEDRIYLDKITWDLSTPMVMAEIYSAQVAQELGLSCPEYMYILHEMRSQIDAARAAAAKQEEMGGDVKVPLFKGSAGVRQSPKAYPMLLKGDQAKQFLETQLSKKSSSKDVELTQGGGEGKHENAKNEEIHLE